MHRTAAAPSHLSIALRVRDCVQKKRSSDVIAQTSVPRLASIVHLLCHALMTQQCSLLQKLTYSCPDCSKHNRQRR